MNIIWNIATEIAGVQSTLMKTRYTKMYLKNIYFILNIHFYVLNTNTLKLYFELNQNNYFST